MDIIIFIPIFAVASWFALYFREYRIYYVLFREIYKGFILYSFYKLIITFFGVTKRIPFSTSSSLIHRLITREPIRPILPFCCLPKNFYWNLNENFVKRCTIGIGQYFIIQFICALVNVILDAIFPNIFREEIKEYKGVYLYFTILIIFSQLWAFYCLAMFLHAVRDYMKEISPNSKFMCIKMIVFFTFWQSILLKGLAYIDIINGSVDWTQTDVTNGLEDFILCIECIGFAIAHHFYFSYKDFSPGSKIEEAMIEIWKPIIPVIHNAHKNIIPIDNIV
jgi:hypothetical protein